MPKAKQTKFKLMANKKCRRSGVYCKIFGNSSECSLSKI